VGLFSNIKKSKLGATLDKTTAYQHAFVWFGISWSACMFVSIVKVRPVTVDPQRFVLSLLSSVEVESKELELELSTTQNKTKRWVFTAHLVSD